MSILNLSDLFGFWLIDINWDWSPFISFLLVLPLLPLLSVLFFFLFSFSCYSNFDIKTKIDPPILNQIGLVASSIFTGPRQFDLRKNCGDFFPSKECGVQSTIRSWSISGLAEDWCYIKWVRQLVQNMDIILLSFMSEVRLNLFILLFWNYG